MTQNWTPQEQAAIDAAGHVDLNSTIAKQVRAWLTERYGADMVTDELVAVTASAMIRGE
jgi:hypothetical protein